MKTRESLELRLEYLCKKGEKLSEVALANLENMKGLCKNNIDVEAEKRTNNLIKKELLMVLDEIKILKKEIGNL